MKTVEFKMVPLPIHRLDFHTIIILSLKQASMAYLVNGNTQSIPISNTPVNKGKKILIKSKSVQKYHLPRSISRYRNVSILIFKCKQLTN